MTPTLSRGLRTKAVPQEQFQPWVNLELLPLLREMRQALNYTSIAKATLATDGSNTPTTIWSSADIASGTSVLVEATVTSRSSANRSAFKILAYFYSLGTVTQEGATTTLYAQDTSGMNVGLGVVANHVELTVTDPGGGIPFDWVAVIEAQVTD